MSLLPRPEQGHVWVTGFWCPDPRKSFESLRDLVRWCRKMGGFRQIGFTMAENHPFRGPISRYLRAKEVLRNNQGISYLVDLDSPRIKTEA